MKDAFSTKFEEEKIHKNRKKLGQFYTHIDLVNYIFSKIKIKKNHKIFDPTVGAGAFLVSDILLNINNYNNIYGNDIDNEALNLCKLNIEENYGNINVNNFCNVDFINQELWEMFPGIYENGGFDLIIGNPPYLPAKKNIHYSTGDLYLQQFICGATNLSTLITAKSLKILKKDGVLAFVLPKTFLRVESFKNIREFIINNYTILNITDLGHYFKDVRGDQIVLIIKNVKPKKNYKLEISKLEKNLNFDKIKSIEIDYTLFSKFNFYPIFNNIEEFNFAFKLLNIPTKLSNNGCSIFRGIGFSSKFLSKEKINNNSYKIYRGDSIAKFRKKYELYIDNSLLDKDILKINKLLQNKIVLQNLCSKESGINANISYEDELSNDTVTNIICNNDDIYFLLGLLNSNFASYFLVNILFLSSNFTMHTDSAYIGQLPIIFPTKEIKEEISNVVKEIIELDETEDKQFRILMNRINNLIYEVYQFSPEEILLIEKGLLKTRSTKHYYGRENE
ncbi:N-6 DNA methylase [Empedobacter falsenii]